MTLTIRPNRQSMRWIIGNTPKQKETRKGDNAALERWTAEGGSTAIETKAKPRKKPAVFGLVRRL